jgi:HNH endonuclease
MPRNSVFAQKRLFVARRSEWCCEYCKSQERFAPQPFTLDHIDPESKGGKNDVENLAYSCQGCNGAKADKRGMVDPIIKVFTAFFNPRTQIWEDHFAWSEDFSQIIGLTATGRVTVIGLKLNRKILIGFRIFLRKHGEHPPLYLN